MAAIDNPSHYTGDQNASGGGGGGGTSSDFGSAFPTSGTAVGFKDSTGLLMAPGNLNASGELKVALSGGGSNAAASATGAAVPASASYTGVKVGANLVGQTGTTVSSTTAADTNIALMNGVAVTMGNGVSGTGVQRVTIASDSTGVVGLNAGTAVIGKVGIDQTTPGTTNLVALAANQSVNISQMNGVTVTMGNGVSGTGVQRVTLASDSTGNIGVAQASTTSGQIGPLIQGAVTTAAPTYTTAQTSPLSLDTTGSLRVAITSGGGSGSNAAASATGAAVPASAGYTGVKVGANLVGVTGTTVSSTTGMDVNLALVNGAAISVGHGTAAAAIRVELPTDGTGVVGLIAGTAKIGQVAIDQTTPGTTNLVALAANQSVNCAQMNGVAVTMGNGVSGTGVQRVTLASDSTGQVALAAGTAVIGKVAIDQTTPGTTNLVALAANQSVNVAQINGVTPLMGAGNTGTGSPRVTIATDQAALAGVGAGATAASVPANAAYSGARGTTALPTAVTDGQTVGAAADKFGRQAVVLGTVRDLVGTQGTTISASTAETTIVTAGGANIFNDLAMLVVSNTSASTNTRIDIRDATAGTVLFSIQSVGGQGPVGFAIPGSAIPQTTANNNWTAQCATSTTDIRIYAVFNKNK